MFRHRSRVFPKSTAACVEKREEELRRGGDKEAEHHCVDAIQGRPGAPHRTRALKPHRGATFDAPTPRTRRPWGPCALLEYVLTAEGNDALHHDAEPEEERHHDDEDPIIMLSSCVWEAPTALDPLYRAALGREHRRRRVAVFSTTCCRHPGQGASCRR